jgi:uncharacterized protein
MRSRSLILFFALMLVSGCGSSPEPTYYTLAAVQGAPKEGKPLKIEVRRPLIPPTLDRPEMVRQSNDVRVHESENHLWSEALDTMMERIIAEDLRMRLPMSTLVTQSSDVANTKGTYIVDVDVQQFGTDAQGNALLQAQVMIRPPAGKDIPMPATLRGAPVTTAESMAKALSTLLGQLCDQIAANLKE